MKKLLVCCALLCAGVKIYAQTEGMTVEDKNNGISYNVTESSVISSSISSTKEDESKAKADDKVNCTPLPGFEYLSQPFINFDGKANLHITTLCVSEETRDCTVALSSVSNDSKDKTISSFEAKGTYGTTSKEEMVRTANINDDVVYYSACANKLIKYCENSSLNISVNGLNGYAWYISYKELNEKYNSTKIFLGKKDVTNDIAKWSKEKKDALCVMLVVGRLGTQTAFPVEEINVYETIESTISYTSTCTPKVVSAGINWNNANVTVDECVDFVEEGAFKTAGIVTRNIGTNNAYHESVAELSSKGNARIGLYVGQNVKINDIVTFIDGIEGKAGLCFIEFNNNPGVKGNKQIVLPEGTNSNCLLFFNNGTKVSGKNIIIDGKCENLVLNRESSTPFYNIKSFTATTLHMTNLPFSNGKYVAYCFPFSIKGLIQLISEERNKTGYIKDMLTIAEFNTFSEGNLSFDIKNNDKSASESEFHANTPYIMALKDEGEYTELKANYVEVVPTEPDVDLSTDINGGWRMIGSYQAIKFTNDAYSYYGLQNNMLKKATLNSTTLKPFSAILIQLDEECVPNLNSRIRVEESEKENTEVSLLNEGEEATGIDSVNEGNSFTSQFKVVSMTGKVVFNGKAEDISSLNLSSGIYIINGKKCVIK